MRPRGLEGARSPPTLRRADDGALPVPTTARTPRRWPAWNRWTPPGGCHALIRPQPSCSPVSRPGRAARPHRCLRQYEEEGQAVARPLGVVYRHAPHGGVPLDVPGGQGPSGHPLVVVEVVVAIEPEPNACGSEDHRSDECHHLCLLPPFTCFASAWSMVGVGVVRDNQPNRTSLPVRCHVLFTSPRRTAPTRFDAFGATVNGGRNQPNVLAAAPACELRSGNFSRSDM